MNKIQFLAVYGDEYTAVELSVASGGANGYQLLFNRRYQGLIAKRQGKWVFLAEEQFLTSEDLCVLGEIIEESEKQ